MGEASESFEASGEVVSVDEITQVRSQLVVGLVEVAFDGRVLDGAVHSLDLSIGPSMLGLCQLMIDVVLSAAGRLSKSSRPRKSVGMGQ